MPGIYVRNLLLGKDLDDGLLGAFAGQAMYYSLEISNDDDGRAGSQPANRRQRPVLLPAALRFPLPLRLPLPLPGLRELPLPLPSAAWSRLAR